MKSAKVPPAEASSSSRRQPVRQTRTNPPRANPGPSRLASQNSIPGANAGEQPIDIFPGVTHFADAITALPKELVRHFTLLKEVDAKIFAPEETLFQLVDQALQDPPPPPPPPPPSELTQSLQNHVSRNDAGHSASTSAQNSSNGASQIILQQATPAAPSVFDPSNLPRRQLFRQTALKISEMLVSLEEKNHVISTANDALHRHLSRIDDIWPHLEGEFSEEAKYGSDSHWAYPENRAARALNSVAERTRREGAASLSAAAQVVDAGDAAARSDARKQAVAAKKSQKTQHQDSDRDDHEGKGKEPTVKKQPAKRKPAAAKVAAGESPASVGLGISGQPDASSTPAPKRRKVEKPPVNGATPTPAITAVFSNAKDSKGKASASPRATPNPDPTAPKKRKALPNSNGQAKKRPGPAASPSVNSSPVISNLPDNTKPPRASPAPSVSGRPASARARQSSIASNVDKQRPTPVAASKPNGVVPAPLEIPPSNGGRGPSETPKITQMEPPSATAKTDPTKPQPERAPTPSSATTTAGPKKDSSVKQVEEEARKEKTPSATPVISTQQVTTTKSGRASKPSTPAIASFPDGQPTNNSRARPARNSEVPTVPKRSHKKGASQAHAIAVQRALQQQKANGGDTSNLPDDDNEVDDPDEPRYCYCDRVSFGEMVGCDGEHCKREWFHLECVGLRNAPPKNMKWFCDDCKKMALNNGKKANGR
ncbi:unnamed protein product [Discula destructiva]